jgi:hypothetical protein
MTQINAIAAVSVDKGYMASSASFNPQYYAGGLDMAHADAAYPLVRAITPEVTLEDWLDHVERRCRSGGLIGLFGENGLLMGLFSYRLGERLRHGRVLALDEFVTFELSHAAPGRAALMAAAEALARSLDCSALEVRIGSRGVAEAGSPKVGRWASLGAWPDSIILVKPL